MTERVLVTTYLKSDYHRAEFLPKKMGSKVETMVLLLFRKSELIRVPSPSLFACTLFEVIFDLQKLK